MTVSAATKTGPLIATSSTSWCNTLGRTAESLEGKAEQIRYALSTGDPVMAAVVVFNRWNDCRVPKTVRDPEADATCFHFRSLAPVKKHGLAQFVGALRYLGLELVVKPIAEG